jgi:diadenosine tetraphosphate (Ap4A) HIT family hydrolase
MLKLFDLGPAETKACMLLGSERQEAIRKTDKSVVGFNPGANDGEEAGQTVDHCLWHLIPRRKRDVSDPRGGIRGVIPGKASY